MSSRRIVSYEDWRAAGFFPALDGLRAVAALMVVFHHARTHWLWGWLEGWNGVTLFFVLSGFLITTLALREEETLGALRWRAFVVRRVFRIVPIYVVSLALYALAMLRSASAPRTAARSCTRCPGTSRRFPRCRSSRTRTSCSRSPGRSGSRRSSISSGRCWRSCCCGGAHAGASGLALVLALLLPAPDRLQLRRACARAVQRRSWSAACSPSLMQNRSSFTHVAGSARGVVLRVSRPARRRAGADARPEPDGCRLPRRLALLLPPVLDRGRSARRVARVARPGQRLLRVAPRCGLSGASATRCT